MCVCFYRVLLPVFTLLMIGQSTLLYFVANPELPTYTARQQIHYLDQGARLTGKPTTPLRERR